MNQLSTEQSFIDSRDVAEMTGKRHDHLIRDIDNYVSAINGSSDSEYNPNLGATQTSTLRADQFFIEKSYVAKNGKLNKHYHLTKKGCEVVANKMTGEKGILFTAEYVTRFNKMEQRELQPPTENLLIQQQRSEATLLDARTQQAEFLEGIVSKYGSHLSDASVQSLLSYSMFLLTGKELILQPRIEEKHHTAKEIGVEIGKTKQMVGRVANKHQLKKKKYGMWVNATTKKDEPLKIFLYNELGKERLKGLLEIS